MLFRLILTRYYSIVLTLMLATQASIFGFLQQMNGLYSIPIFAVILMGLLNRKVPAAAANFTMLAGLAVIAFAYFIAPRFGFDPIRLCGNNHYFLGVVFLLLMGLMSVWSAVSPRQGGLWVQQDAGAVNLTPWRFALPVGILLLILVVVNYAIFADFSVLR